MKKQKQYTICIRLPSTQGSELVLRGLVEAHSRETLVDTPTRYTSPPRDTPTRDTDRDRDTARTPPVPTADYLSRRQLKLLGNLIVTNLNSAQGPTHPLGPTQRFHNIWEGGGGRESMKGYWKIEGETVKTKEILSRFCILISSLRNQFNFVL